MTALASNTQTSSLPPAAEHLWRQALRSPRVVVGGAMLLTMLLCCLASLPWTAFPGGPNHKSAQLFYDRQEPDRSLLTPRAQGVYFWFGTDKLGHSLLARCLMGGVISLTIGVTAAAISVVLGVGVGLLAGYRGGWLDSLLMRSVDVLYGLPYILLVILFKTAFERPLAAGFGKHLGQSFPSAQAANLLVLFLGIGLVSWLTMARVIRGQVLSLRAQPFIEACRAGGLTEWRIFTRHLLPNLVGPITVYATLTVPAAILQESFLSFLGVGIQAPLPTWGSLASDGLSLALNPVHSCWWLLAFPCTLLALTLLSLNFMGDGLRDVLDPKREAAKI